MRFLFLLLIILSPVVTLAAFNDTAGYQYNIEIHYLQSQNIIEGFTGNVFKPNQQLTRAEYTKILLESAKVQLTTNESCINTFSDVTSEDWFYSYAVTASCLGILKGYNDGTFRGNNTINYAEAAKIAVNTFDIYTLNKEGEWYLQYISALNDKGLTLNPAPQPSDTVTRGQMAHIAFTLLTPESVSILPNVPKINGVLRPINNTDHIYGNKLADISLIEFADFGCPFCEKQHPTMKKLVEHYGDDVNWVYRHLTLDSIHPYARGAALASECAAEQGEFWTMSNLLFKNERPIFYKGYANILSLDINKFEQCQSSEKYSSAIAEDKQDARDAGVSGTPSIVIYHTSGAYNTVSGLRDFDNMISVIDEFIQKVNQ